MPNDTRSKKSKEWREVFIIGNLGNHSGEGKRIIAAVNTMNVLVENTSVPRTRGAGFQLKRRSPALHFAIRYGKFDPPYGTA